MVADLAVVGHMRTNHEQSVIADPGQHPAAFRFRVHGRMFADDVVGTYFQAGRLALVFEILRRHADGREGIDRRARADCRMSRDDDMGDQSDTVLQHDIGTYGAVRTDDDALPQPGL